MNVNSLQVAAPTTTRYQSPLGIQLGLDFESQGTQHIIPLTSDFSGFVSNGNVLTLGQGDGPLCSIRVKWDPPDLLAFQNPGGTFPDLDNLLIANGVVAAPTAITYGSRTVELLDPHNNPVKTASRDITVFGIDSADHRDGRMGTIAFLLPQGIAANPDDG